MAADESNSPTTDDPDPSDIEPLGDDEGVYQRDHEGKLTPLAPEVIEWGGEHRTVRFFPVPVGQFDEYESLGDNVEMNQLCEIMAEKVHTPDRTAGEWADTDPRQFMAILSRLVEKATGQEPMNDLHAELQAELDGRGDSGN